MTDRAPIRAFASYRESWRCPPLTISFWRVSDEDDMTKIIHVVIAETSKSLAYAAYEEMAKVDRFYRMNPKADAYVARNWRHFIPFARQSLAGILAKDFKHEIASGQYSPRSVEVMKEEIFQALLIDGQYKAPAPIDLATLRKNAGFEPIDYAKGHRGLNA